MKRILSLLPIVLLAGCALFNNIINSVNGSGGGGSGYIIPVPGVGQWVAFGGAEPTPNGSSWPIPCCNGSQIVGYYYTKPAITPQLGQTLTINYTLTGNNPVYVQAPASGGNSQTDINPPTIHLFMWQKGDDLACDTVNGTSYAQYRIFSARTPLVIGSNQTISASIDPSAWTGCYGQTSTAAQFQSLLNNLLGIGITFGGQYFAGHGIYLSSGSAQFTVNSVTIQ